MADEQRGVAARGNAAGSLSMKITRKDGTREYIVAYQAVRKYGGVEGACKEYGYDPEAHIKIDFTGNVLVVCPDCGLAYYDLPRENLVCPARTTHKEEESNDPVQER